MVGVNRVGGRCLIKLEKEREESGIDDRETRKELRWSMRRVEDREVLVRCTARQGRALPTLRTAAHFRERSGE